MRAAPAVRHAHRDDRGKEIRPHQRRMPGNRRTPVVADDQRARLAERGHQRDHVADVMQDRVGGGIVRRGGLPEAAHVGRDGAKACVGERGKLMPPRIPELRPAVTHQHQRAVARFGDMDLDPVRRDRAMSDVNGHSRKERIL